MNDSPLVSVVLVTYNSAKYLLESLESIKNQSYNNIELIITDDASTDSTIEICENWKQTNKNIFSKITLITSTENSGTPRNCNRGLSKVKGKYVKFFAGDDIMAIDAIESLVNHMESNDQINVLCSHMQMFIGEFDERNFQFTKNFKDHTIFDENATALDQFLFLLRTNIIYSTTTIFRSTFLKEFGGFDEEFKLFEDYPLWQKITASGCKIHYYDRLTAYYRRHKGGASNTANLFSGMSAYEQRKYALTVFNQVNTVKLQKPAKYELFKHYFNMIKRPYGGIKDKLKFIVKLLQYWPGLKMILKTSKE